MRSLDPARKLYLIAYSVLIGVMLFSSTVNATTESTGVDKASTALNVELGTKTAPSGSDSVQEVGSAPGPGAQADNSSTNNSDTATPKVESSTKVAPTVRLHAEVIDRISPELSKNIDDLTIAALDKIRRTELLEKEKHYKKGMARLAASTRDLAELCTSYRGFEQSSEAADIILDEKIKLKSGAAVSYSKQKQTNAIQESLITALMQIATGIGSGDQAQGKTEIRDGEAALEELTDKEHAEKTVELLKNWSQSQRVQFPAPLAGPMQIQAECKDVLGRAIQADPVVKQITSSLHKYNGRSNFARASAKVVNTVLSVSSMSPTFISPASQIAWTAYIMTQGGPEESKLLKEVYLAKSFENRYQTLNSETCLAVNSYNSALISQNSPLLAFSQFVVQQLCQPPQSAVQLSEVDSKTARKTAKIARKSDKVAHDRDSAAKSKEVADQDSAVKPEAVASQDSNAEKTQ